MLTQYVDRTQRLLQHPVPATNPLYSQTDIISYVNTARKQLAGEGQVIRRICTIDTVLNQREYSFSDLNVGVSATTGIAGVFNVRRINFVSGDGELYVTPRPWEWFDQYCINNPVPYGDQSNPGARYPQTWSQYGQGGQTPGADIAQSGSFYVDPIPDGVYTLKCDCVCYPIDLVDDTTKEAIPFIFTDAVPFFAAWYALLSSQMQARRADAEAYYSYYQTFLDRGRKIATPSVLGWQYEGAPDPAQQGKAGAR